MKRKMLFVSAVLTLVVSHVALADDLCQKAFKGNWVESHDKAVAALAKEFIIKLRIGLVPFTCSGFNTPPITAMTKIPFEDYPTVLFIAVDSRFRKTGGKFLRAVMAHEIAHYGTADGRSCGMFGEERFSDFVVCEARVDALAAKWTSKAEMLACLYDAREFLRSRPEGEVEPRRIEALNERIRLMSL